MTINDNMHNYSYTKKEKNLFFPNGIIRLYTIITILLFLGCCLSNDIVSFNSAFELDGLSEWLFELVPDNVDFNRYNINRSNNDWIFRRHNSRSKFICIYCTELKIYSIINPNKE